MAKMTKEEIEQLRQRLMEKVKEVKAIEEQLLEAGELEVPEECIDQVSGGGVMDLINKIGDGLTNEKVGQAFETVFGWLIKTIPVSGGGGGNSTYSPLYTPPSSKDTFGDDRAPEVSGGGPPEGSGIKPPH